MTLQYEKPVRKNLRKLAGLAHEHEFSSAMENLSWTSCEYTVR